MMPQNALIGPKTWQYVSLSINPIINEEQHTMNSPTVTRPGGWIGVPELFMAQVRMVVRRNGQVFTCVCNNKPWKI